MSSSVRLCVCVCVCMCMSVINEPFGNVRERQIFGKISLSLGIHIESSGIKGMMTIVV